MKKRKRVNKKKFNLLEEYKKSLNYLRESKKFIYAIIGIFFFFVLFGYFIPPPEFIYTKLIDFIRELFETTKDLSMSELIKFIIANNTQSTFFGIILGMFLGVFPIINAIMNGYMLGFVSMLSVENGGLLSLWRLLPHGIFELPAIFISLGLGLKFGTFIFQKEKLKSFADYFLNSMRIFLLIVIPLLIIAGIIEGALMVFFP
ncbi:MAG: stage II sporulation protein M [Candidatus Nanoarchaeia archaeon]|nr:stage II sporulation protein M [Candidatus Nanoarchaeia archaeon]MDD5358022.1 stage II sporulation protein M [Candidatus Nanoarchaeia archaeon]MDD5588941.1 stage II sporulation protein M [Candidatus Nanoarchaeia archaeon]